MTTHKNYNIPLTFDKNLFIILLLSVIILILIIPIIQYIMLSLGISLLLALLLNPMINQLESKGVARVLAIGIVFIMTIGIIGFVIFHLKPIFTHEIRAIEKLVNSNIANTTIKNLISQLDDYGVIESLSIQFYFIIQFLINTSIAILTDNITIYLFLLIIPIVIFLLLKDGYDLKRAIVQSVSNRYFEMIINLMDQLNQHINKWLRKQLFMVFILMGLTIFALYLLNIPYYLTIGVTIGLALPIPYYGSVISAVIASTIIILETGFVYSCLEIIIAIATIKLLHNLLLAPAFASHAFHIHPLLIILILIIGSYLWGLIGLLTIIPAMSILILIGKDIYQSFKNYHLI